MVVEQLPAVAGPTRKEILAQYFAGRKTYARGELARVIRDLNLGCTRERVRQIVAELGLKPEAPAPPKLIECSGGCGKILVPSKTGLCSECRHNQSLVNLTCTSCGSKFERPRAVDNAYRRRKALYRTGPFCRRSCSSKIEISCAYCGDYIGFRYLSLVKKHRLHMHSSCHKEALNNLTVRAWTHATPDLWPIREHLDEINAKWRSTLGKQN